MWAPKGRALERVACAICGKTVDLEDARRCMGCGRVVCLKCFDIPRGVCAPCLTKLESRGSCPEYIG